MSYENSATYEPLSFKNTLSLDKIILQLPKLFDLIIMRYLLDVMKPISLIFPLTSDWKTGNKCKKNREENIKSMSKHTRYMILVFNLCIFRCPCSVWLKDNNYVWRGLLSLSLQSLSCFITAVSLNLHRGLLLQYALTDNHLNTIFTRYEQFTKSTWT